jgi:hypothetical protein
MVLQSQSIREQRRDQMYPAFDSTEIERVRKFGKVRSFAGGERLWTAGQVPPASWSYSMAASRSLLTPASAGRHGAEL